MILIISPYLVILISCIVIFKQSQIIYFVLNEAPVMTTMLDVGVTKSKQQAGVGVSHSGDSAVHQYPLQTTTPLDISQSSTLYQAMTPRTFTENAETSPKSFRSSGDFGGEPQPDEKDDVRPMGDNEDVQGTDENDEIRPMGDNGGITDVIDEKDRVRPMGGTDVPGTDEVTTESTSDGTIDSKFQYNKTFHLWSLFWTAIHLIRPLYEVYLRYYSP